MINNMSWETTDTYIEQALVNLSMPNGENDVEQQITQQCN